MKNAIRFLIMDGTGMPLVVKVGGSLFSEAAGIVSTLRAGERPLLVVPGGGPFTRIVRSMHIPDEPSHWMAIRAMDEYGWFLAAGGIPVTHDLSLTRGVVILLPLRVMRERDPLPHSWDVTSDTISAWVASELRLDLLILKSVDGIMKDGTPIPRISEDMPSDVVDPCLIPFALAHGVRTTILNGRVEGRVRDFLKGREVPGTVIEPRL